jgi:hypothetical protein
MNIIKATFLSIITLTSLNSYAYDSISNDYRAPEERRDHRDHRGYEERNTHRQTEIDQRIDRIQARIDRGARYGSLTWRERRELSSELNNIRRLRNNWVRDGRMNRDEFSNLTERLDRLSDRVREEKHDHDRRRHDYR